MLPSCTSLWVGGRIFWYIPSAPIQGSSVEMSLKPQKHQCEDVHSEETVGLKQLSCLTAAGHCTQVPAASPGGSREAAGSLRCAGSLMKAVTFLEYFEPQRQLYL